MLELRYKLDATSIKIVQFTATTNNDSDILNALFSLGYNDREANWAIKQIAADATVSDGIRQALQLLSKEK
ncbi:MAG: hypothetical protein AAB306_04405 [Pseudomonadota bacterium]